MKCVYTLNVFLIIVRRRLFLFPVCIFRSCFVIIADCDKTPLVFPLTNLITAGWIGTSHLKELFSINLLCKCFCVFEYIIQTIQYLWLEVIHCDKFNVWSLDLKQASELGIEKMSLRHSCLNGSSSHTVIFPVSLYVPVRWYMMFHKERKWQVLGFLSSSSSCVLPVILLLCNESSAQLSISFLKQLFIQIIWVF